MVTALQAPAWLHAIGLPSGWRGQPQWRMLDTHFGSGERFLQLWQAWSHDEQACQRLHVVALSGAAPGFDALLRASAMYPAATAMYPAATALMRELESQWFGLMPGFHRLVLFGGRLRLTLCIGPTLAQLRQQQFLADSIVIGAPTGPAVTDGAADPVAWDGWALKSLARLCRRGTTLAVIDPTCLDTRLLAHTGWQPRPAVSAADPSHALWSGAYQPHWQIKSTRAAWARAPTAAAHCIVIGAGLAGAAVADALAQRGKQVTVLDAASAPAAATSSLPAGLFAPQVSRDDGPRSRLSRAGIRMTLLAARRLLQPGQDWALSGVVHARNSATPALPAHWPCSGIPWATTDKPVGWPCHAEPARATHADAVIWHTLAGWIKPAQLVRAWLSQPPVHFVGQSTVHAVTLEAGQWRLWSSHGKLLAEAPQLVMACAGSSFALLEMALAATQQASETPLPKLEATHGQVSWAIHGAADTPFFPSVPVNGAGSVLAHVPQSDGEAWLVGATYEPATAAPLTEVVAHAQNLARLAQLAPDAAHAVAPAFASAAVRAWRGTRWSSIDRLPIAGAWPTAAGAAVPGLWISTAMGSRGLTYAALCGELIAAQMCAEPLPLDAALHAAIDVQRLFNRAPTSHVAGQTI